MLSIVFHSAQWGYTGQRLTKELAKEIVAKAIVLRAFCLRMSLESTLTIKVLSQPLAHSANSKIIPKHSVKP